MLVFLEDTKRTSRGIEKRLWVVLLAVLGLMVSGCAANYDERSAYLLEMAQRGVEVNKLFRGQGQEITEDLCNSANLALNDDIPSNRSWGYEPTEEWEELVRKTFVNACVSGEY